MHTDESVCTAGVAQGWAETDPTRIDWASRRAAGAKGDLWSHAVVASPGDSGLVVRVGFGSHVLARYRAADGAAAQRYADAVDRRCGGLRVTVEPLAMSDPSLRPMPSERLWSTDGLACN
ncbi:MAG: hypothetical protein ACRCYU_08245 [Nocardioides sp.]